MKKSKTFHESPTKAQNQCPKALNSSSNAKICHAHFELRTYLLTWDQELRTVDQGPGETVDQGPK
eukprot:3202432-Rhodomonas_salina.2